MSAPTPEPSHGPDFSGALTRKIGPLPGYAYVVAIVVGVYLYRRFKGGTTQTVSTQTVAPGDTAASSGGSYTDAGALTGLGTPSGTYTNPVTGTYAGLGVTDNGTWGQRAVGFLESIGLSGAAASNIIASYLDQNKAGLNPTQQGELSQAINSLGPPPQGVLPVISAPTPAPKPRPKPPVHKPPTHRPPKRPHAIAYVTHKGDTFEGIAQRVYGSKAKWTTVRSHFPTRYRGYSGTHALPAGIHVTLT